MASEKMTGVFMPTSVVCMVFFLQRRMQQPPFQVKFPPGVIVCVWGGGGKVRTLISKDAAPYLLLDRRFCSLGPHAGLQLSTSPSGWWTEIRGWSCRGFLWSNTLVFCVRPLRQRGNLSVCCVE